MKWVFLRAAALMLVASWLSGCMTGSYLPPDGQMAPPAAAPKVLSEYSAKLERGKVFYNVSMGNSSRDFADAAEGKMRGWFAEGEEELTATFSVERTGGKGLWTIVPYMLTLSLIPAVSTDDLVSTLQISAGDQVLYVHKEQFQTRNALSTFFPTPYLAAGSSSKAIQQGADDQMARHARALGEYIANSQSAYEKAVSAGTVETYRQFLRDNPTSFFRMETLSRLAELAPARNAIAFHRDNLELDSSYLLYLPDNYDVWFVGPEDMRVHDVLTASKEGDEVLLVSRIKAAGQPYKIFDAEEIALLKEGGLSSALIAAMIDVSASNPQGAPAAAAAPAVQPSTAQPVAASADAPQSPGAADIAAQCAKRYAALKACDNVPGFGANICRSQVKKKYSHVVCSVVQ